MRSSAAGRPASYHPTGEEYEGGGGAGGGGGLEGWRQRYVDSTSSLGSRAASVGETKICLFAVVIFIVVIVIVVTVVVWMVLLSYRCC